MELPSKCGVMFLSGVTLFPGEKLPLRIFEPRYREMLDQVLKLFSIQPNFDLDIMGYKQALTDVTKAVLEGLDKVLKECEPDRVLVHGDTTTSFTAALAAFYKKIPVGHVEAGLRTGDIYAPWPEEMNRRLTDTICDLHFAPTQSAEQNLIRSGIEKSGIFVTGNTVIDALFSTCDRLENEPEIRKQAEKQGSEHNENCKASWANPWRYEYY